MGNFNKLSFPCLIICRIKLQEDAKVHFQKIKGTMKHCSQILHIMNKQFTFHSPQWKQKLANKEGNKNFRNSPFCLLHTKSQL